MKRKRPSDDEVTTITWGRLRELLDAEGLRLVTLPKLLKEWREIAALGHSTYDPRVASRAATREDCANDLSVTIGLRRLMVGGTEARLSTTTEACS